MKLYYHKIILDIANQSRCPYSKNIFEKYQDSSNIFLKQFYRVIYLILAKFFHIEISLDTRIDGGLYLSHAYGITINPKAVLGKNCNIHKNVTIGQENRGKRKGVPTIGNRVWIGIGSTVVGKITIGDNVLIAPNSYVNCDVSSNSIVLGNPCIIKPKADATVEYINNLVEEEDIK